MTTFTRLGSSIWDWEPWTELGAGARILWLALYTSAEGRRCVPGLWHGGIPSMADAARMQPDEVRAALDQLLERDMVEFDAKARVLRLCELPDAGEFPSNGNCIKSWWTRFNSIPECPVRDAHVRTLRWILDEGAKRSRKGVSHHHEEAWATTFALITVPAPRRRGVRRLADSDTSTGVQPSLFAPIALPSAAGNGFIEDGSRVYPQDDAQAVDNSAALHQLNKIRDPETVTVTVTGTYRIPDPGSRIPDLSGSSPERGIGGGHDTGMRNVLTLVPETSQPFTAVDVLRVLGEGAWNRVYDQAYLDAIAALIPRWVAARVTLDDFGVLARLNALAAHPKLRDARELAGVDLPALVAEAKRSLVEREERLAMLREFQA